MKQPPRESDSGLHRARGPSACASDVIVRAAEAGDAMALAELMRQLGYETSADEMERRIVAILSNPTYATFVAVRGGVVCGMIGICFHHSYEHNDCGGRILALVVSETSRDRGIGRELIRAAEDWFTAQKVRRVALNTRFQREAAHKFYEKLGYVKNGYRFVKDLKAGAH
jgi:ribosomal protein S18 acetylase RimI-like enzyme